MIHRLTRSARSLPDRPPATDHHRRPGLATHAPHLAFPGDEGDAGPGRGVVRRAAGAGDRRGGAGRGGRGDRRPAARGRRGHRTARRPRLGRVRRDRGLQARVRRRRGHRPRPGRPRRTRPRAQPADAARARGVPCRQRRGRLPGPSGARALRGARRRAARAGRLRAGHVPRPVRRRRPGRLLGEQAAAALREARAAARAADREAARLGLSAAQRSAAAQAAAERVLADLESELLDLAISYGQTGIPRLDDPNFVASVVFEPGSPGQPKPRFSYLFPSSEAALISVRLRPDLSDVRAPAGDRADPRRGRRTRRSGSRAPSYVRQRRSPWWSTASPRRSRARSSCSSASRWRSWP